MKRLNKIKHYRNTSGDKNNYPKLVKGVSITSKEHLKRIKPYLDNIKIINRADYP